MNLRSWILSVAVVLMAAAGYLFYCFVFGEMPKPAQAKGISGKADAIVVLTGGRGRTNEGLAMLRKGAGEVLILSGVNADSGVDAIFMKRLSASERPKIILEKVSKSTYGNAVEVRRIMSERGFKSMALVTSDYHMKRADYIFGNVMPPDISISLVPYQSSGYQQSEPRGLMVTVVEFFKYYWYVILFNCGFA